MKKILAGLIIVLGFLGWLIFAPPEPILLSLFELERERNGLEHKTVQVQGETWHYLEGGSTENETIVLIHGFGADKDNWLRFSKNLVAHYHVIAPDLPGFGESARHSDWDYRLPEQVARIHTFLSTLNIQKFHLAGNSMGGFITGLYTVKHPQQVITAGFINAAGVAEPQESELTKALKLGQNPLLVESPADFERLLAFVTHTPPFIPPAAKSYLGKKAFEHREFNQSIFKAISVDARTPLENKLPKIAVPSLVMWGDTDRALHVSMADVFHKLLPNSKLSVLPQTGHLPMLERPNLSAQIYLDFINQH